MVTRRLRCGGAGEDVRRPCADRRVERTGRLEGRDRPAIPPEGSADAVLDSEKWMPVFGKDHAPNVSHQMSKVGVVRTILVFAVFAALELLCRAGVIDRLTMIPPTEMVASLADILLRGRFNADIAFTLYNAV